MINEKNVCRIGNEQFYREKKTSKEENENFFLQKKTHFNDNTKRVINLLIQKK